MATPQPALSATPDAQAGLRYLPASVAAGGIAGAPGYEPYADYALPSRAQVQTNLDRMQQRAEGSEGRAVAFEERTFSETQEDITARRYAFEQDRRVQPRPEFFQRYNFQAQTVGLRADAVRPASYVVTTPGVVAGPATLLNPQYAQSVQNSGYHQTATTSTVTHYAGQAPTTAYVQTTAAVPPPGYVAPAATVSRQISTTSVPAQPRVASAPRAPDRFAGMSMQEQTSGGDASRSSVAARTSQRTATYTTTRTEQPVQRTGYQTPYPNMPVQQARYPAANTYSSASLLPPVGQEGNYSFSGMPQMPPARPGQCFALVRVPEQYRTVNQQVVTSPAHDRFETVPAQYQTEYRQVTVRDGYEQLQVTQPTFNTVTGRILERPGTPTLQATQPVVEQRVERILVKPAEMVWKLGRGPVERIDHATGEIMCLVEEPAVYQTVTRNVVVQPAQVRQIPQPDIYRTVTTQVVAQPPQVQRVQVPPQIATIAVQRLVRPESTRRIPVPAQYSTIQKRELVRSASLEWRAVLCETNLTPAMVRQVQMALQQRGYPPGPIDGIVGPQTMAALKKYQRDHNLPMDNYINIVSARHLGLAV